MQVSRKPSAVSVFFDDREHAAEKPPATRPAIFAVPKNNPLTPESKNGRSLVGGFRLGPGSNTGHGRLPATPRDRA